MAQEQMITELFPRLPKSKNNLLNFQNLAEIVFPDQGLHFLQVFFQNSQEKLLTVKKETFPMILLNSILLRAAINSFAFFI